jgi:hypothetical protein
MFAAAWVHAWVEFHGRLDARQGLQGHMFGNGEVHRAATDAVSPWPSLAYLGLPFVATPRRWRPAARLKTREWFDTCLP